VPFYTNYTLSNTDSDVLFVTRKRLAQILGSPKWAQAAHFHKLIQIVRPGCPGRETLYDYGSVLDLGAKIRAGFQIPPLPSDVAMREFRKEVAAYTLTHGEPPSPAHKRRMMDMARKEAGVVAKSLPDRPRGGVRR